MRNHHETEFMTKEIAADLLHLSPRRVLELASEGKIRTSETYNPETKRRQTVLSAEDVKRLAGERTSSALVLAAAPPQPAASPQLQPEEPSPNPHPLWLTIDQAEVFSGLPAEHIEQSIASGELAARDVGIRRGVRCRWRVKRSDLEAMQGTAQGNAKSAAGGGE
jgi:hypothetical protein